METEFGGGQRDQLSPLPICQSVHRRMRRRERRRCRFPLVRTPAHFFDQSFGTRKQLHHQCLKRLTPLCTNICLHAGCPTAEVPDYLASFLVMLRGTDIFVCWGLLHELASRTTWRETICQSCHFMHIYECEHATLFRAR